MRAKPTTPTAEQQRERERERVGLHVLSSTQVVKRAGLTGNAGMP